MEETDISETIRRNREKIRQLQAAAAHDLEMIRQYDERLKQMEADEQKKEYAMKGSPPQVKLSIFYSGRGNGVQGGLAS